MIIDRTNTTHCICRACWDKKAKRRPAQAVNAPLELCCFCGDPSNEGIYITMELSHPDVLCDGIHESYSDLKPTELT